MSKTAAASSFAITARNRVVRRPARGRYDKATVYGILDAALVCHIAYVIDGQPYCTPTSFWREGDHLDRHGSSASRMLSAQADGVAVCLTVTHVDALVLARCGFNHSINYRSAMVYGTARLIEDEAEKLAAIDNFIDRLFPGMFQVLDAPGDQEGNQGDGLHAHGNRAGVGGDFNQTMHDDEEDYAVPAWTALLPIRAVVDAAQECPRQMKGVTRPEGDVELRRRDAISTRSCWSAIARSLATRASAGSTTGSRTRAAAAARCAGERARLHLRAGGPEPSRRRGRLAQRREADARASPANGVGKPR